MSYVTSPLPVFIIWIFSSLLLVKSPLFCVYYSDICQFVMSYVTSPLPVFIIGIFSSLLLVKSPLFCVYYRDTCICQSALSYVTSPLSLFIIEISNSLPSGMSPPLCVYYSDICRSIIGYVTSPLCVFIKAISRILWSSLPLYLCIYVYYRDIQCCGVMSPSCHLSLPQPSLSPRWHTICNTLLNKSRRHFAHSFQDKHVETLLDQYVDFVVQAIFWWNWMNSVVHVIHGVISGDNCQCLFIIQILTQTCN